MPIQRKYVYWRDWDEANDKPVEPNQPDIEWLPSDAQKISGVNFWGACTNKFGVEPELWTQYPEDDGPYPLTYERHGSSRSLKLGSGPAKAIDSGGYNYVETTTSGGRTGLINPHVTIYQLPGEPWDAPDAPPDVFETRQIHIEPARRIATVP